MPTRHSERAGFQNFELRFHATLFQVWSFAESLCEFMLLHNANFDSRQKVSILSACNPSSETMDNKETTEDSLKLVNYK